MSDDAADLVLEYASAIERGASDTVHITAFGADGDEVVVTLLLGQAASLIAESVTTSMSEPDNSDTVDYVRSAMERYASPPHAHPDPDYQHHPADDD